MNVHNPQEIFEKLLRHMADAPHSASSLTLYALVSTLERAAMGGLFKLNKLQDLTAQERRLAYALMEIMASGRWQETKWRPYKEKLDELLRQG